MPIFIPSDDLEESIADAGKPLAFQLQEGFPYDRLTDRQFECLLRDLADIQRNKSSLFGKYTSALLMQGVGERGRDCALVRDGIMVGAIQCKKYQGRVTKPSVAREVIKFCLHALMDSSLIPNPNDFTYTFVAAQGFSEPALILLTNFKSIVSEPNYPAWRQESLDEYKAFKEFKIDQLHALDALLSSITVSSLDANSLNTLIQGEGAIVSKYFSVRTVIDSEPIVDLSRQIHTIAGALSDADTERLQKTLIGISEKRRLDFGFCSLWGYSEKFLDYLKGSEDFKEVGKSLADAKLKIDALYAEQFSNWATDACCNEPGFYSHSPVLRYLALPYISGRLLEEWRAQESGQMMTEILTKLGGSLRSDALSLRVRLQSDAEHFFTDDWSRLEGPAELIPAKKRLIREIFGKFKNSQEVLAVFDGEWSRFQIILDVIIARLIPEVKSETVIVLRGGRAINSIEDLKTLFDKLKKN